MRAGEKAMTRRGEALEFEAQVAPDRTLPLPRDVAEHLAPGQRVRVILLLEAAEDDGWNRLTAEEFLKGYAESDAVYDRL